MIIGRLDRPISIIKTVIAQNDYGENTLSTTATTSAFARIETEKGSNSFDADALVNVNPTKMIIRWTTDIDISPLYWIKVENMGTSNAPDYYRINAIEEIGRREGLILYCDRKNIEILVETEAAFTPESVSNLDLYYDFSTLSGTAGDDILTFVNGGIAGTDYNLAGGTATKRPTIDNTTLEKPCARFDGNDRFTLDNAYATSDETFTVFWVIKKDSVSESDLLIGGTEGAPINKLNPATANALVTQFNGEVDGGSDNSSVNLFLNNTDNGTVNEPFTTATSLYIFTRDASEIMKLYSKDAFVAQGTSATDGAESTNFRVGMIGSESDGGAALTAYIGEIGIYNKVISDTERADLITYLKDKWAI